MELDLASVGSRGYCNTTPLESVLNEAKAIGKINNEKDTMLFDSGAEGLIIDTSFARKVGCMIDEIQTQ